MNSYFKKKSMKMSFKNPEDSIPQKQMTAQYRNMFKQSGNVSSLREIQEFG